MREGRWDRSLFLGRELLGQTLGIVGLGRIGGEIATRAHAFGMRVIAFDPSIAECALSGPAGTARRDAGGTARVCDRPHYPHPTHERRRG